MRPILLADVALIDESFTRRHENSQNHRVWLSGLRRASSKQVLLARASLLQEVSWEVISCAVNFDFWIWSNKAESHTITASEGSSGRAHLFHSKFLEFRESLWRRLFPGHTAVAALVFDVLPLREHFWLRCDFCIDCHGVQSEHRRHCVVVLNVIIGDVGYEDDGWYGYHNFDCFFNMSVTDVTCPSSTTKSVFNFTSDSYLPRCHDLHVLCGFVRPQSVSLWRNVRCHNALSLIFDSKVQCSEETLSLGLLAMVQDFLIIYGTSRFVQV